MILTLQFMLGGAGYVLLELLYRRKSHISMFIAGGVSLLWILTLADLAIPFMIKCVIAGLGITAVEFTIGCVVNLALHLHVWDYSTKPVNILGQICLPYTALWCVLSGVVLGALELLQ